jgi:hypothetical protein
MVTRSAAMKAQQKRPARNPTAALQLAIAGASVPEQLQAAACAALDGHPNRDPVMSELTINTLMTELMDGELEFFTAQRGWVFSPAWASSLVWTLLHTHFPLPPVMVNRTAAGISVVCDGKQRLSVIIAFMTGMLPVSSGDEGQMVFACCPDDDDYHTKHLDGDGRCATFLRALAEYVGSHGPIVEYCEDEPRHALLSQRDRDAFVAKKLWANKFLDWPMLAASCVALVHTISSMQQTPGEVLRMMPNRLTEAFLPHADSIGVVLTEQFKIEERFDSVFLMAMRGFASALAAVPFVPKASDANGMSRTMVSLAAFISGDLPEGTREQVDLACTGRLETFVGYYTENVVLDSACVIKKWKDDMVSTLFYGLVTDMDVGDIYSVLKCMEKPKSADSFSDWYKKCWTGRANMADALRSLSKLIDLASRESGSSDSDAE